MRADVTREYVQVRRAYEVGRLRSSAWKALLTALPVMLVGVVLSGPASLVGAPAIVAAWVFLYWRGEAFLRGGFYGLLGGALTSLLPLSILRPCCALGVPCGGDCCTMPGACLAAGVLVGVALAAFLPLGKTSWWRTALGMMLGMTSVAILRCATLFAGEALGLVGGLLVGVAAASAAKTWLAARSVA